MACAHAILGLIAYAQNPILNVQVGLEIKINMLSEPSSTFIMFA